MSLCITLACCMLWLENILCDVDIKTFLVQVRVAEQKSAEVNMAVDDAEEDGVFTSEHYK